MTKKFVFLEQLPLSKTNANLNIKILLNMGMSIFSKSCIIAMLAYIFTGVRHSLCTHIHVYEQGSDSGVKNECGLSKIGHLQSYNNQLNKQIIRQIEILFFDHINSST